MSLDETNGANLHKGLCLFLNQQNDRLGNDTLAILASSDGSLVASSRFDVKSDSRFSAMASALLSLSETLCNEVLGSANDHTSFSTSKGHIALVRLTIQDSPYLMMFSCPADTNLAFLMRHSRDLASKLIETLANKSISLKQE